MLLMTGGAGETEVGVLVRRGQWRVTARAAAARAAKRRVTSAAVVFQVLVAFREVAWADDRMLGQQERAGSQCDGAGDAENRTSRHRPPKYKTEAMCTNVNVPVNTTSAS